MDPANIEIRQVVPSDRHALAELFVAAGKGAPTGTLWGDPESEASIYLTPYLESEPQSLYVADYDGALVGYLTGCVDTASFPSDSARIDHAIRTHRLWRRRRAMAFFARAALDTTVAKIRRQRIAGEFNDQRWPAHLHINVVPAFRGTGVADQLMQHWLTHLDSIGSPGCHLQTLVENERARRFFERHGFEQFGTVALVPGLRFERRRVHQLTMVRPQNTFEEGKLFE